MLDAPEAKFRTGGAASLRSAVTTWTCAGGARGFRANVVGVEFGAFKGTP